MKYLTKTILLLSFVSLFTDIASEMLYPVIPIYLKSIGFSIVIIGILEGIAEALSGLSKGYFGSLSDKKGSRLPFVRIGYALSAISKPLMAVTINPFLIFFARTLDRFGKGVRTAPRDALLSDESTKENKGKVFGFHRGMDTLGAVIGPAIALIFLWLYPSNYTILFYFAFIPGLISILFTFLIKEKNNSNEQNQSRGTFGMFIAYIYKSSAGYKKAVIPLLIFSVFNSSDFFLLLILKYKGFEDTAIIFIYILYNLSYSIFSYPLGATGDKIGFKKTLVIGFFLFSATYLIIALTSDTYIIILAFILYGIYAAATEGISKAWISNIVPKSETATAIGTYTAFNSIALMLASFTGGLIWYNFYPEILFYYTSAGAIFTGIYYIFMKPVIEYS